MMTINKLGIYIHVPFCTSKCRYCDFLSFSGCDADYVRNYIKALLKEIQLKAESYSSKYLIDSIFIGGGTPSLIDSEHICLIIKEIFDRFQVDDNAEITIESNPNTLTNEKLDKYRKSGINRISMGVQSLNDDLLKYLGRIHSSKDFLSAYECARNSGFENINMDLMFALPTQTETILKDTLLKAIKLKPEHISLYSLQLEENTVFYNEYLKGRLRMIDECTDRRMYHESVKLLETNGYIRYEISNFAKENKECRHNLKYWSMDEYLGLGLGAHSYINGFRTENIIKLSDYIKADKIEDFLLYEYKNSKKDDIVEYMITTLRKSSGFDLSDFQKRFGISCFDVYPDVIEKLIDENLMYIQGDKLKLSDFGIDISNEILCKFV